MQIIGKHNTAQIMLDNVDETTYSQIQNVVNCPALANSKIVIMPDCHAGAGCVIGFTQTMNEFVIPNLIGVDIGCGVTTINVGNTDINFEKLDRFIKQNIPSGHEVNDKIDESAPKWLLDDISTISKKIKKIDSGTQRNQCSLGSLGGGNHFIEVGVDEKNDKWITVHSGSRKFGLDIANYHQKQAKNELSKNGETVWKNLEFLSKKEAIDEYLNDMKVAQHFATINRKIILDRILFGHLAKVGLPSMMDIVESVHNYINFEDKTVRKGAIQAYKDQKLVIPFNMEDGLIIGVGKSNPDWNFSAPHGAGRLLSRKQAKEKLDLDEARQSMKDKGIYTTSLNHDTLDEARGAYKNKKMILEAIVDTVDVLHFVKPIYNFKAGE